MQNVTKFQLFSCESLLLFFVIYDYKLNIFEFGTVCRTKQDIFRQFFLTFYRIICTKHIHEENNEQIKVIMRVFIGCNPTETEHGGGSLEN